LPIGPPARASGPMCPMQAPVETPEKRASVRTATSFPHGMCFRAAVTSKISSIPAPIGPRQTRTTTSPGRTGSGPRPLIAARAPPGFLPPVEDASERLARDGETALFQKAEPAQVKHHFRSAAGEEDVDGRMVARPVGKRVDQPGNAAVDRDPVVDAGPRQAG